jgi:hypothetical protein
VIEVNTSRRQQQGARGLDLAMRNVRAGDTEAFSVLYEAFSHRVFGLCRHLLGSAPAAEDAVSEVFLRAQRAARAHGFAVLVGVPAAALLAALTVVGIPVALATPALYAAGLYLAKVFVAAMAASLLWRSPRTGTGQWTLALFIGLVLYLVVAELPFGVGAALRIIVLWFGLGAFSWQIWRSGVRSRGAGLVG